MSLHRCFDEDGPFQNWLSKQMQICVAGWSLSGFFSSLLEVSEAVITGMSLPDTSNLC